jgi:uncharacterized protein
MKIDPRAIPESGLSLQGSLPVADYAIPADNITGWNTLDYSFQVNRTGSEITVTGTLGASFQIQCARCLDPIPWTLEINDFCQILSVPEDSVADLTPLIREDIILSLPLAPRCELDSAGRCPRSGRTFAPSQDDFAEKRRATVWRDLDQLKREN